MTVLLETEELTVELPVRGALRTALRGVSMAVDKGEAVAIVGESGSGKSMLLRAIGRLLPSGARASGQVSFLGEAVLEMPEKALRSYRTSGIGMIFQDPRASINPVLPVGDFLTEPLVRLRGTPRREARRQVVRLLDEVGVSRPEARLRQFPHELSGGLLQRVMIAAVLAMEPMLILADEPTTALDVTTQSDVMSILDEARRGRGMGLVLVTHDLELAAAVCDRTTVMYGGRVMEEQPSALLHDTPLHPYTAALLASRPSLTARPEYLKVIPGRPLSAVEAPAGCPFADRCVHAEARCASASCALRELHSGRTGCIRAEHLWPSPTAAVAR